MELVIFIGGQAAGKSTYFASHFANTHVRINLDMLRTRHREAILLRACLEMKQPCVIDNTNPLAADRARYIGSARANRFRIVGYYFELPLEVLLARNATRAGKQCVPEAAIRATVRKLDVPSLDEGFDALFCVRIQEDGSLVREVLAVSSTGE